MRIPVYWLETFIDPARFKGDVLSGGQLAASRQYGGRGHNAPTKKRTQPVKELFGLPLTARFRELLGVS